jgi:type 1 glutamine amidotransferase
MKKLTQISIVYFLLFSLILNGQNDLSQIKNKRVLIVYGGWEWHYPEVFATKIASWLEDQKAIVTLSKSTKIYLDEHVMNNVDLIIQHITMSEISELESKALQKAIAGGVGLAGCHGGLGDAFRNNTEYQYMVGGQFVKHPGGQVDYSVKIAKLQNPILKGINNFTLHSEQYYMHVDPAIKVLATTRFSKEHDSWIEGIEMPVVWTKSYGKGRVFYSSLGHNKKDFEIPEVWEIMIRGVTWAAGSKMN